MTNMVSDAIWRHIHRVAVKPRDLRATDAELLQQFATDHDETAFKTLFQRHGPMVLAVARRILGNAHDAEDVCQAAFLLLAKKAASQRWKASVGSWLYKTALQLALKARTAADRRARREGRAAAHLSPNPLAEITGQELLAALDEELLALPELLREPLVACYLQGATRDEAAQRLGCPLATLKKRLERGRARLQAGLARRGLEIPAVLLAALATQQAGDAAIINLTCRTAEAALALAARQPINGVVSTQVRHLINGGSSTMSRHSFKAALILLVVGGVLATASGMAYHVRSDEPAAPPARAKEVKLPAQAPSTTLRYKFKEGDAFRYVVEKKTEFQSNAPSLERLGVESRTYDVTWKINTVDSEGNARVYLTIDRIRYVSKADFGGKLEFDLEFDSKVQKNPVGVPSLVRVQTALLKSLVGAEFTCTMSPRGEISDFKVPKRVADAVRNSGQKEMHSTENLKQLLAAQGAVVLPKEPIVKAGYWNEKSDLTLVGGHARMGVDSRATYLGEVEKGERKLAEISLKPTATGIERVAPSGLGPFRIKNHDGRGSILFDNDRGRLIETRISQAIDIESGPTGQAAVWKNKVTLSTKLVPAK